LSIVFLGFEEGTPVQFRSADEVEKHRCPVRMISSRSSSAVMKANDSLKRNIHIQQTRAWWSPQDGLFKWKSIEACQKLDRLSIFCKSSNMGPSGFKRKKRNLKGYRFSWNIPKCRCIAVPSRLVHDSWATRERFFLSA